jgi:hypothetical protein
MEQPIRQAQDEGTQITKFEWDMSVRSSQKVVAGGIVEGKTAFFLACDQMEAYLSGVIGLYDNTVWLQWFSFFLELSEKGPRRRSREEDGSGRTAP